MKIPLTGGAYTAHSVIASAQRSLNLFSEPMPQAQGEPMPAAHYPTPGIRLLGTIGAGPIRGIHQATQGHLFVVSGDTLYLVDPTSWTGSSLGTLTPALRTPVSMADNGLDLVVVDGSANGWHVTLASTTFAQIVDPNGMFVGGTRVDYLDTFFILNKVNTPGFYISGSLALTFDPLDFANKESYSDLLVTAIVAKRLVYLLGRRTTEIWYNAGATFSLTDPTAATSFQFAPMQSEVFIDHGIVAPWSAAVYDTSLFWLTRDRQGQGIVMKVSGYDTKRVSTYAIEAEIAGYGLIYDAIGFCYQLAGHTFYVLTFPSADKTWCYDITTQLWHEWAWIDANGDEHRHRANCFSPVTNLLVVGDWQNGNLYALDNTRFDDNGSPIKRVRSFPHLLADGRRVFYRQFLADMETGNSPAQISGTATRLNATFTAADYTPLASYVSEVGGGWAPVGGAAYAQIIGNAVTGTGGTALYQSGATLLTADYTLRFSVIPPAYDHVVSGTSMWVIGRATGANTGYRAMVSADGTRYTLTLSVLPSGASVSVVMGTLASGTYTVSLAMQGPAIIVQAQRTQDALYLRGDATWQASTGTIAAQITNATYTAPGVIMVGGTWPTPALMYVIETPLASDPNFPSGYSYQLYGRQTFDFTRDLFYQAISDTTNGGIAVTSLSAMAVTRTVTLAQMYAGTSYGVPPGSPPSQAINSLTGGNGTDLYMMTSTDVFSMRFTRISPSTMKVTGELAGVQGLGGVVNTTATHTIVAYDNGNVAQGPLIYDGTGMTYLGLGPTPLYGNSNNCLTITGAKHADGSCDFIMLNSDNGHPTGSIDIWRIKVSDSLTITSTKTGTVNVLAIFPAPANLYIAQADYDTAHDAIVLQVTNSSNPAGPPVAIVSAQFGGTINWAQGPYSEIGSVYSKGQSLLTGTTLMTGSGGDLRLFNTATGALLFTGTVPVSAGALFRVYDGSRVMYWTYTLSVGFTRISFPTALALDNVAAVTQASLLDLNQISLRWSNDRGHSWGSPVAQDIGEIGEYWTSLQWQRLGMARDRCFELSWSVPMATALQGCWLDAELADGTPPAAQSQGGQ